MFPTDYIIFLQIILFLFISPGPPRVVIVSHTLNYGLNRSVWTAFGDISANTIQAILVVFLIGSFLSCLLYTSPSPRDGLLSRMPSSA